MGLAAAALAWPYHRFLATTATVRLGVGHRDADLATRLQANLPLASSWLATYLTVPVLLLALLGLGLGLLHRPRKALFLGGLVAGPVLAFAAVSTLWFPRYLVMVTVPALLLAADGFLLATARLPSWGRVVLLALVLLPALRLDRDILFSPATRGAAGDRPRAVRPGLALGLRDRGNGRLRSRGAAPPLSEASRS